MNRETILDYNREIKGDSSNKLRHFTFFYLFQIFIVLFIYWIGADAKAHTVKMDLISLSALIVPLALTAIMIHTFKSTNEFKFYNRIIPILGLLLVEFVSTVFLNFIGAFGRKITSEEFVEGLKITTYFYLFVIIPLCLICGAIIKSGKRSNPKF